MFFFSGFSGLGQDDTDYIAIDDDFFSVGILVKAFAQSGFAIKVNDKSRLLVLPGPLGAFVDSSVSDPSKLECLECPAGSTINNLSAVLKYQNLIPDLQAYTLDFL